MKKSVYSLVLMDDVVEAIDRLAYSMNTSRSNLINQILAEKVALVTPKQHLQTIFDRLAENLQPYAYFQIQNQAADHILSIKSVLRYKYNPTIRYSIYLLQGPNKLNGQLRVVSRTKSDILYYHLNNFFEIWNKIEKEWLPVTWQVEDGAKWLRPFHLEAYQHPNQVHDLALVLSHYVRGLDDGLKIYFNELENHKLKERLLREHYKSHYGNQEHLV